MAPNSKMHFRGRGATEVPGRRGDGRDSGGSKWTLLWKTSCSKHVELEIGVRTLLKMQQQGFSTCLCL